MMKVSILRKKGCMSEKEGVGVTGVVWFGALLGVE